jgi:putative endonuclease
MKIPVVYMLASKPNGTLYIGVTSNLPQRIWLHKHNVVPSFTQEHSVRRLVYYELHGDLVQAIECEKRMKKWRRAWKVELIEKPNPQWLDLYSEIQE